MCGFGRSQKRNFVWSESEYDYDIHSVAWNEGKWRGRPPILELEIREGECWFAGVGRALACVSMVCWGEPLLRCLREYDNKYKSLTAESKDP